MFFILTPEYEWFIYKQRQEQRERESKRERHTERGSERVCVRERV